MKLIHFDFFLFIIIGFAVCCLQSDAVYGETVSYTTNKAYIPVDDVIRDSTVAQQQNRNVEFVRQTNGSSQLQQQYVNGDKSNGDRHFIPYAVERENTDQNEESFDVYFAEFLKGNPDVKTIRSPQDMDNINKTWKILVEDAKNIELIVHLLDINPYTNFLYIKGGFDEINNETAVKITGPISPKNIQKFKFFDTNELYIFLQFVNSQSSKYAGFVLTYKAFGEPVTNSTEPNGNVTIPVNMLPRIKILLEVPKANQTLETWSHFRTLLTVSANSFIRAEKLSVEQCSTDNITFVEIVRCSTAWPNSENCIKIDLAISLKVLPTNNSTILQRNLTTILSAGDDLDAVNVEYELTVDHLRQMWINYGKPHFAENRINEFLPPNTETLLLVWICISLSIIGVFIVVLYFIWKIDFLRDYRRMNWKNSEDQSQICKQSEIDISMFPSPHQIVPTLFPNDTAYSAPNKTDLPFEYLNQPISFQQSDFQRRPSIEESVKLDRGSVGNRENGLIPFQSDIVDFNEPHQEDEISFNGATTDSPRSKIKFRSNGRADSADQ